MKSDIFCFTVINIWMSGLKKMKQAYLRNRDLKKGKSEKEKLMIFRVERLFQMISLMN